MERSEDDDDDDAAVWRDDDDAARQGGSVVDDAESNRNVAGRATAKGHIFERRLRDGVSEGAVVDGSRRGEEVMVFVDVVVIHSAMRSIYYYIAIVLSVALLWGRVVGSFDLKWILGCCSNSTTYNE